MLEHTDGLAGYLENLPLERAVLFPCSDEWVAAVNALPDQLSARYLTSLPPAEVLDTLLDKGRLEELGAQNDVPRPRTVILDGREDLEDLPDDRFESAFLKPCESRPFAIQYGVKAFAVADREDALARFDAISADGHRLVLQEYIQGPASEHYLVDGFVDVNGRVCTMFARHRLRMYPLDFGDSSYICSVPRHELKDAIDGLARLLQTLNYRGIFSAEFKRDRRDGEHKLLEINTRAWTYVEFPLLCGINIPLMAYRDAQGLPVDEVTEYDVGKGLSVMPLDMQAARALQACGELSAGEFFRQWRSAYSLYFRRGDLGPGWVHTRALVRGRLRRWLGRPPPPGPPRSPATRR